MTSVLFGLAFILFGVWGMNAWFGDLLLVLRGLAPLSLFLGGVVALIVGLSSFRPAPNKGEDSK